MTEYELHQLIMTSRAEFDQPYYVLLAISLMAFFIGLRFQMSKRTSRILTSLILLLNGFLVLRILAAMVRFAKLNVLLQSGSPEFLVSNPSLQWPTFILRILSIVLVTWLAVQAVNEN